MSEGSPISTCRECLEDFDTYDLNDSMVCYVCDHLCDEACSPCQVINV